MHARETDSRNKRLPNTLPSFCGGQNPNRRNVQTRAGRGIRGRIAFTSPVVIAMNRSEVQPGGNVIAIAMHPSTRTRHHAGGSRSGLPLRQRRSSKARIARGSTGPVNRSRLRMRPLRHSPILTPPSPGGAANPRAGDPNRNGGHLSFRFCSQHRPHEFVAAPCAADVPPRLRGAAASFSEAR